MMNILIQHVTDDSLSVSVLAGDVIRLQKTLVKGDGDTLALAGRDYGFDEIKVVWEMNAALRGDDGSVFVQFPLPEQVS